MPALPVPRSPLTDGVVALRPWGEADAAAHVPWGRDPEIVRWTGVTAGYTEEDARERRAFVEQMRQEGRGIEFAVVDAASGALLGSCDLRVPSEDPRIGEIGFLLDADARGRGRMTRAITLLARWAFEELAMARLQALVHPDNERSRALVERMGFRREGLLRSYRDGDTAREDRLVYSLLPDDRYPGDATRP
jgi:RimJ/RimL family protein N-acetyltransferase